jgi:hypothetical protein
MTGPGGRQVSDVRDVLIHVTGGGDFADEDFQAHPPIAFPDPTPVLLADDLRIEALRDEEAEAVMDACTLRGVEFKAYRQFGQRYSFIRSIPMEDFAAEGFKLFAWDHDNRLYEAVVLSRLIVDNATSTEWAARIITFSDGHHQIVPAPRSEANHIYRIDVDARDWLDHSEGEALRQLLARFYEVRNTYSERVNTAIWLGEYARQTHWVDLAIPLTVTAVEGLISSGREHVTRQFVERVPRLATELGVNGVSKNFCRKLYDDRSHGVHAGRLPVTDGTGPEASTARLRRSRERLTVAERRLIEDRELRSRFDSDQAVQEAWPVTVPAVFGLRRRRI